MAQFYTPKRRVTSRENLTVSVTDLDAFGQGVARHNGKTLFITGALPGEEVDVMLCEEKKQYARARLKRIRVASAERQTPRCPLFGRCGGCQQQHVSVTLQQQSKASALSHLLRRETGVTLPEPMILADNDNVWGYRRRARLGLQYAAKQRQLIMGFRRAASNDLVAVDSCPILRPELNALLLPLRQCLATLQVISRPGHVELVLVLRHLTALSPADQQKLEQFSRQHQVALWLAPDSEALQQYSGEVPWYQVDGLRLSFSVRDFIQINGGLNQRMVAQAIEWLDVQPEDRVLDLFCGMGNFSLPLAKRAQSVCGVEGVAALVAKAAYNAQQNDLRNAEFFLHNLQQSVVHQPWAVRGFNKVLLDPARAGAAGVMPHVAQLRPSSVIYVSCNAATLARDSRLLLASGYQMSRVAMLDMFPHTGHLESMVLFSRK